MEKYNRVVFDNYEHFQRFCGVYNENIKIIEEWLKTKLTVRNNFIAINNNNSLHLNILREIKETMTKKNDFSPQFMKQLLKDTEKNDGNYTLELPVSHKIIKAKNNGQTFLMKSLINKDIVLISGPAGTGKTFLSVAVALFLLEKGRISRIVLTRPAVDAGESLGYLPGDLLQKIEPYLKPLYDALFDIIGIESVHRLIERGIIEVLPLAYMRGRTLNNAFIILDEAQNTTSTQMKMFLTRLGENSKMAITGDITQIDLKGEKSGIIDAMEILASIKEIGIVRLKKSDIVRHRLVQKIVQAYEQVNE